MTTFLDDRLYTRTHEWVKIEGDTGVVGISDYAQEELNDIVYVELPEVGDSFARGEPFGVIESVKAASDIYMPMSGEVIAVNEKLSESPQLVNEDPFGAGWLIKFRVTAPEEREHLLDASAYQKLCAEEG